MRNLIKKLIVTVLSIALVGAFCFGGLLKVEMNDVYAAENTKKDIADVAFRFVNNLGVYLLPSDYDISRWDEREKDFVELWDYEADGIKKIRVTISDIDGLHPAEEVNHWGWTITDIGTMNIEWYLDGNLIHAGSEYMCMISCEDAGANIPNAILTMKITVIESEYFYGSTEVRVFGNNEEDNPSDSGNEGNEESNGNNEEDNEESNGNNEEDNPAASGNEDNEASNGSNEENNSSNQSSGAASTSTGSSFASPNNNVVKNSAGESITSTIPTQVNSGISAALTTHKSVINYAAGLSGSELSDGVYIQSSTSDSQCGEMAKQSLQIAAESAGAKTAHILEIHMDKVGKNGAPLGEVEKLLTPVEICLSVPDGIDVSLYDFAIVRLNEDGTFVILPNTSKDSGTITFKTNQFGVFSIIYGEKGCFK